MRGTKLITTLALSAILFTGCGLKQDAIIKINDKTITQNQFDKAFDQQVKNSIFAKLGVDIKGDPNGVTYLMIKDRVLNELIIQVLLDEEMSKRGIKVTQEDVNNAIKELIDHIGSKEQLETTLKQNGLTTSQFKKELEKQIKVEQLVKQLGDSSVSDAEALKFYKENPDKFKYPEKIRASHILISTNPTDIQQALKALPENKKLSDDELNAKVNAEIATRKIKADKLYNEAKNNIDSFAKLARENSDDTTTAEKGGDLGFFAKGEMLPEFEKGSFTQRPNTIAPLITTKYGYHIVLVTDRMAAGQVPFEKAKSDIQTYLTNQKQVELLNKLTESLKKNAKIEFINNDYNHQIIQEKIQKSVKEHSKNLPKK